MWHNFKQEDFWPVLHTASFGLEGITRKCNTEAPVTFIFGRTKSLTGKSERPWSRYLQGFCVRRPGPLKMSTNYYVHILTQITSWRIRFWLLDLSPTVKLCQWVTKMQYGFSFPFLQGHKCSEVGGNEKLRDVSYAFAISFGTGRQVLFWKFPFRALPKVPRRPQTGAGAPKLLTRSVKALTQLLREPRFGPNSTNIG